MVPVKYHKNYGCFLEERNKFQFETAPETQITHYWSQAVVPTLSLMPASVHTRVGVCMCELFWPLTTSTFLPYIFDSVCHQIGQLLGTVVPTLLILPHLIHHSGNRKHMIWHVHVWFNPLVPLQAFVKVIMLFAILTFT